MSDFIRGFRLHLKHGRVLDGAEFPNGRVVVMDDPEWGLCSGARTADLLTIGYPDSRIEWAEDRAASDSTGADEPAQGEYNRPVAAHQATRERQTEPACALPDFTSCDCNHITGCQHPTTEETAR